MALNFIIHLEVYPFDIMVSIAQTDEQLLSAMKKVSPNGDWDSLKIDIHFRTVNQAGFYIKFTNGTSLIRFRHYPKCPYTKSVLAHETFHAITELFDSIGMKFDCNTSTEAYAYAIQYLTQKIYEKIKEG